MVETNIHCVVDGKIILEICRVESNHCWKWVRCISNECRVVENSVRAGVSARNEIRELIAELLWMCFNIRVISVETVVQDRW
jgi:hypothetical protein